VCFVVLHSLQDNLGIGTCDLDRPIFCRCKKHKQCLYGVPNKIISDRGSQLTSKFWEKIHKLMGTKLTFSSAYHPQNGSQTERTNQILKDILRACTLKFGKSPYAEFCITIVFKRASRWHLLMLCLDGSVGPHFFGVIWEKAK
jgi:transposase InsO family protein